MCENCSEYDDENETWDSIGCGCACAGDDLNPSETLEDGSVGAFCSECNHRVG